MPQQINLCTPVLLTQRRYFSARAMVQSLAVFVALGGALTAYGVWSLNSAASSMRSTLDLRAPELASLRSAIAKGTTAAQPGEMAVGQELQSARAQLLERQKMLAELRRGLMPPGQGHSARLLLLAQSIPSKVWITQVVADESQLEVRGFTEEPAALNDWLAKLAQSPLLLGQQLERVKVERVGTPANPGLARADQAMAAAGPVGVAAGRALWSFRLASVSQSALGSAPASRP